MSPIETRAGRPLASWRAVAVLAAVLVAVQAGVFFGLRAGETRALFHPAQVASSIELYGDRALTQTFLTQSDGLTAITVYPRPRRVPSQGTVELTLEADPQTPIAQAAVPAAEVFAQPEFTWTFPPVENSARRLFRLRVGVPGAAEGSGLSFAIGPPYYPDGALHVGGRAQWGDLRFQTRSQHARVVDLLRRRPAGRLGAWVPIAACAAMVVLATSLAALALALIRDRAGEGRP